MYVQDYFFRPLLINSSLNSHSISLFLHKVQCKELPRGGIKKVLEVLPLGSPLIKDALTKAVLMRKQQLGCSLQTTVSNSQHMEAFVTATGAGARCKEGSIPTKPTAVCGAMAPGLTRSHSHFS